MAGCRVPRSGLPRTHCAKLTRQTLQLGNAFGGVRVCGKQIIHAHAGERIDDEHVRRRGIAFGVVVQLPPGRCNDDDAESWNPELRAPLAVPGVNVSTGDYVLAINGVELRAPDNMYRLLDGTANRQTVLTVNSRPDMQGARTVTVMPIANEQGLRTRAWVESNRRKVDSLSGGKLAYVYLPNTGQPGYTSFNRYYFAQQDRQGVVVDERYNGGGSAADYIVDLLDRKSVV